MAYAQRISVLEVYPSPIRPAASEVGLQSWLLSKLFVQMTKKRAAGWQRDDVQFGTEVDLDN